MSENEEFIDVSGVKIDEIRARRASKKDFWNIDVGFVKNSKVYLHVSVVLAVGGVFTAGG